MAEASELERFADVMHALRRGCPWDAEQTHLSLVRFLVEETAEVVEAIEDPDHDDHLVEELGDLLLQVLFHSEIAAEEGISRQGVHDAISSAEAVLEQVERAAGCVARAGALRDAMQRITAAASALAQNDNPAVRQRAQEILAAAASVKE